jgi:hypothetical protein
MVQIKCEKSANFLSLCHIYDRMSIANKELFEAFIGGVSLGSWRSLLQEKCKFRKDLHYFAPQRLAL